MKKRIKKIESKNSNDNDYYIAVDIGKKNCVVCITDKDGSILEETKYNNTFQEAERFASRLNKKYDNIQCHAVCESTANMWLKTYEAFEKFGIDVKLANPMKTKAIAEARVKTDKLDARTLAHLLRSNLIAESYIAPDNVREDRSLLRLRINLVSDRTRVMNRVHSLLDKYDLKCKYDHIFGVNGIRWLKSIELKLKGNNDQVQLANYIKNIEFLNSEITQIEKQISTEASQNENVKILMSMTGIDCFSAMLIASEIGDISRFSTAGKLVSWCGLCPTVHQSGNSMYMGRMKKDGNKKINWIMIQAANTASRTDDRLKKYYMNIAKRHGHHVVITHVANKMMRIIWSMLTYKQLYNERKKELYEIKLKRIQK